MPGLENLSRGWYTLRPPGTAVEETEKPTTRSRRNPDKNAYRGNNKRDFAGDGSGPFSSRQKKKSTQMTRLPFSSDQLHRSSQYASFGSLILERSIAFMMKMHLQSLIRTKSYMIIERGTSAKERSDFACVGISLFWKLGPQQPHTPWPLGWEFISGQPRLDLRLILR
ncbi:hypothetical protein PSTT_04043, partial [Puccinia striiformis]